MDTCIDKIGLRAQANYDTNKYDTTVDTLSTYKNDTQFWYFPNNQKLHHIITNYHIAID